MKLVPGTVEHVYLLVLLRGHDERACHLLGKGVLDLDTPVFASGTWMTSHELHPPFFQKERENMKQQDTVPQQMFVLWGVSTKQDLSFFAFRLLCYPVAEF